MLKTMVDGPGTAFASAIAWRSDPGPLSFVLVTMCSDGPALDANVAVTDRAPPIATVQALVPAQAPLQPAKADAASGVAVSETVVPPSNDAAHVAPQSIPGGIDVT